MRPSSFDLATGRADNDRPNARLASDGVLTIGGIVKNFLVAQQLLARLHPPVRGDDVGEYDDAGSNAASGM
jgi:hypothetical protein